MKKWSRQPRNLVTDTIPSTEVYVMGNELIGHPETLEKIVAAIDACGFTPDRWVESDGRVVDRLGANGPRSRHR